MRLWVLAVPNAMKEHRFTDDVAICRAWTKHGAIKMFKTLYGYSDLEFDKYVKKVRYNNYGIAILTDY